METKFLLRTNSGDQPIAAEAELRDHLQNGKFQPSDFLFDYSTGKWGRLGEHSSVAPLFAEKPGQVPDRRVIYFLPPGGTALGPFSTKEIQARCQRRELCPLTWVFVEGDKEWRQVRNVKILNDMLPPLPTDVPAPAAVVPPLAAPPAAPPSSPGMVSNDVKADGPALSAGGLNSDDSPPAPPAVAARPAVSAPPPFHTQIPGVSGLGVLPPDPEQSSMPSIKLDLGSGGATPPAGTASPHDEDDPAVEREEITMALDTMGLNLHSAHASLPTSPPAPPKTPRAGIAPFSGAAPVPRNAPPPGPPRATAPGGQPALSVESNPAIPKPRARDVDTFEGIVAEIPMDPIWLVKQATNETVSGPFRFLEIIEFLEQGKLTKNDKIARTGTKAFVKIQQQYEFNVKFSLETIMENGQEKQKILIRRRHPRVPYMTGVQIVSKHGLLAGQCVNVSAGGILMEVPKAEFNLGDIIEVKIMPGLIAKSISCKALIIGKIPKIPPGYALKFEDLKNEDKEAIEHYVQETLKREMSKKT